MKISELFKIVEFEELIKILRTEFELNLKTDKSLNNIRFFFETIRDCIIDNNNQEEFAMIVTEDDIYITNESNVKYAFNLDELDEISNYKINEMFDLTPQFIAAHILYELAFYGGEKERQAVKDNLIKTSQAISNKEYTSVDDDCFLCTNENGSLEIKEDCPHCNGTGKSKTIIFDDESLN